MPLNAPDFLPDERAPERRRLCVCLSDVHCTDGTVGRQAPDAAVWPRVFAHIRHLCETMRIDRLWIVLAGDLVDMIRTREWADPSAGPPVLPWETDHPEYRARLWRIFEGIRRRHGDPPDSLFAQLRQARHEWPRTEPLRDLQVFVVPLLGNHDKELLRDPDLLRAFWEMLGMDPLPEGFLRYLRRQYGRAFAAPDDVPWPPFYWVDSGFRMMVTHGQWRDPDNHRATTGWRIADGWRPETWRRGGYAPFVESCFGDTVAAGLLSGFVSSTRRRLQDLAPGPERRRVGRILGELDLYRPSYAAIERLRHEIARLARRGDHAQALALRTLLEEGLLEQARRWLDWPFTLASASPRRRAALRAVRALLGPPGSRRRRALRLRGLYLLFRLLHVRERLRAVREMPLRALRRLPAFTDPGARALGLQLHVEGHTHVPLQADLDLGATRNLGYVNLGTWRDRIVRKRAGSYRRRGVGRMLCVLDLPDATGRGRRFRYWVLDETVWSDAADDLEHPAHD